MKGTRKPGQTSSAALAPHCQATSRAREMQLLRPALSQWSKGETRRLRRPRDAYNETARARAGQQAGRHSCPLCGTALDSRGSPD